MVRRVHRRSCQRAGLRDEIGPKVKSYERDHKDRGGVITAAGKRIAA
jgi:hypothetical protein